jgi:hypothetical protein
VKAPIANLEDLTNDDVNTPDAEIEAYGKTFVLRAFNNDEILDYISISGDAEKAKYAGVYCFVMSVVDANGQRVPKEQRDDVVAAFRRKSAVVNRRLIRAAREVNNLEAFFKEIEAGKNVSGEATSDASPTV